MPTTDADLAGLVAAARRGVPEAWDALFRRYQSPLYAYAVELLRDPAASLDVVQETFVRALRHLDGLRDDTRLGAWLFGIAHQRIVHQWRRRGREPWSTAELDRSADDPAPEPGPDLTAIRQEEELAVLAAIDELPPAQRSVILLFFLEDFSLAEIAEATATTVGTVKSRLHYAKAALRRKLTCLAP